MSAADSNHVQSIQQRLRESLAAVGLRIDSTHDDDTFAGAILTVFVDYRRRHDYLSASTIQFILDSSINAILKSGPITDDVLNFVIQCRRSNYGGDVTDRYLQRYLQKLSKFASGHRGDDDGDEDGENDVNASNLHHEDELGDDDDEDDEYDENDENDQPGSGSSK